MGYEFFIGYGAGRIKIFVSTPNLRNIVPFFTYWQLLTTATRNTNLNSENRIVGVPGEKPKESSVRCAEIPQNWFFTSGTPTILFSKSKLKDRVVAIDSYQQVKKWNHISKIWRRYEDFKRQYPIKNPYPIYKIPCFIPLKYYLYTHKYMCISHPYKDESKDPQPSSEDAIGDTVHQ